MDNWKLLLHFDLVKERTWLCFRVLGNFFWVLLSCYVFWVVSWFLRRENSLNRDFAEPKCGHLDCTQFEILDGDAFVKLMNLELCTPHHLHSIRFLLLVLWELSQTLRHVVRTYLKLVNQLNFWDMQACWNLFEFSYPWSRRFSRFR